MHVLDLTYNVPNYFDNFYDFIATNYKCMTIDKMNSELIKYTAIYKTNYDKEYSNEPRKWYVEFDTEEDFLIFKLKWS